MGRRRCQGIFGNGLLCGRNRRDRQDTATRRCISGRKEMAPQVGLEPTTLRLTAECSAIELLRNEGQRVIDSRVPLAVSSEPPRIDFRGLFCTTFSGRRTEPGPRVTARRRKVAGRTRAVGYDPYSSRSATTTGARAARSAGGTPPATPMTSANASPKPSSGGVILNAKAR